MYLIPKKAVNLLASDIMKSYPTTTRYYNLIVEGVEYNRTTFKSNMRILDYYRQESRDLSTDFGKLAEDLLKEDYSAGAYLYHILDKRDNSEIQTNNHTILSGEKQLFLAQVYNELILRVKLELIETIKPQIYNIFESNRWGKLPLTYVKAKLKESGLWTSIRPFREYEIEKMIAEIIEEKELLDLL